MTDRAVESPPAGLTPDEAAAMRIAADAAIAYRLDLPGSPARPTVGLGEAGRRFGAPLGEHGAPAAQVVGEIVAGADGALHAMAAPTFFGYVLGGSHPVGVAADMLVSAWGQNAGSSFETPAISAMERAVCDWVIDLLGLPPASGAGLVSGGTTANMVGVMAARHALWAARGWDVEREGIVGAPPIDVLIGADAHSAPLAALRYAGFGDARAVRVATDAEGRIRPDAFAAALDRCTTPPLVILQAGQINTGAFDPFDPLIDLVRERDGWVHVDGAFGLWLAAVPKLADRLAGVGRADSWAVDLHKWLNAPFDAGVVVVRDRPSLVATMSARGSYLPPTTDWWEPADSTPELSRRARGVPSYAILRHLGREGVRELVARHCELARRLAARVAAEPGLSVLNEVHSNQVAIACGDGADGDALTSRVLERVQERGRVYPTHGDWAGRRIIRASVIGYAMRAEHVDLLADELVEAWRWVQANP
ncbi:MAG: aminotransferase class V-fold PLP-dependent enzyme [Actinomycetales bacterium]|nr:aminotransferase class V-fold PLP-dependent enzyme [Actinomycetales bacterium]